MKNENKKHYVWKKAKVIFFFFTIISFFMNAKRNVLNVLQKRIMTGEVK